MKAEENKCNPYGKVNGLVLIPNFNHIMSDKIRTYLFNKELTKLGIKLTNN